MTHAYKTADIINSVYSGGGCQLKVGWFSLVILVLLFVCSLLLLLVYLLCPGDMGKAGTCAGT